MKSKLKPVKATLTQAAEHALESYQAAQIHKAQTVAVIKPFDPGLTMGGSDMDGLTAQTNALEAEAQQRDHALADCDAANNAEHQGFLTLQTLDLALPKAAKPELDDNTEADRRAAISQLIIILICSRIDSLPITRVPMPCTSASARM